MAEVVFLQAAVVAKELIAVSAPPLELR